MFSGRLSIVIPAFNEVHRLGATLEAIRQYALRSGRTCQVIVVDDGSRDGTADIVRGLQADPLQLRLLVNPVNRGKGYAVRQGMLAVGGDAILMCDADLSTPIEEVEKLAAWLERGYEVVIGSRDLADSFLDPPQPLGRRLLAWGFRAIRRRLLLPAIRDTQCGFKLFTRPAAAAIFARQTIDGWLFDCEVLGLAERLGYRIREVGVVWRNRPETRVHAGRELYRALPTLLAICRRLASLPPA
jgi:dolichyl-phosphate beta-glucosyltransferase